jgi:hypothetical protein
LLAIVNVFPRYDHPMIDRSVAVGRRRREWLAMLCAVLVTAATFVASGRAQPATTAPGKHAIIPVTLLSGSVAIAGGPRMARGVTVSFYVRNLTKGVRQFTIFGKKTALIRPGHTQVLKNVYLPRRGLFKFLSLSAGTRPVRGIFIVY